MSKKTVSWLVFIVFFVFTVVASYFYYIYHTKQAIQDLINKLAPVVDISVAQIEVGFEGAVLLSGLKISPRGYQDNVLIDSVELQSPSPIELFKASEWFQTELPARVELKFASLIFNMDADFLHSSYSPVQGADKEEITIWGLACAKDSDFLSVAKALGWSRLQINGLVSFDISSSGRLLKTAISINSPGLARAKLDFSLSSNSPINFLERSVLRQTKVDKVALSIVDQGYNLKRLRYCAKQENINESNYFEYLEKIIEHKMLPGVDIQRSQLEESVLALFAPDVNVLARFLPKETLSLPRFLSNEFSFIQEQGVDLVIDGKRVSTNYLSLLNGFDVDLSLADVEQETKAWAEIKKRAIENQSKQTAMVTKYSRVSVAQLASYQGGKIRLKTRLGEELDGVLVRVERHRIIMQRRVEQGLVTYPVLKSSISSVKVYK